MRKYVDLEIFKQGSASAKVLAPLFTAIIDKLASTSVDDGQVSTVAITIGEPAKTGDNLPSNSYKVTNTQADIDQVIGVLRFHLSQSFIQFRMQSPMLHS